MKTSVIPATEPLPIGFDDVRRAAERLRGVAHRTPVVTSRTVDAQVGPGARVFLKCENFQRGGAFKFRGALNALTKFSTNQQKRGVISFSSGNHAQAVALAAKIAVIAAYCNGDIGRPGAAVVGRV